MTIENTFAKYGLFTVTRDPIKILETQVECALNLREAGGFISTEAGNSDHDEEYFLSEMSSSESGRDSH